MTPALAPRGMVACPHALASAAGVDALRAGGSAVDAAIAAASSLAVLYPHMCGIGGDAFWLIYDAAARKVSYLDGGGRAAAAATLERFAGQSEIPFRGLVPATLTTPGAVASFCAAHERYGRLPLARCLQDAIHYARDGYPGRARALRAGSQRRQPSWRRTPPRPRSFSPKGSPRKNPATSPRHAGGDRRAGPRRILRGRRGDEARRSSAGSSPSRPRRAGCVLGRADPRQLSRRHDLRDAGADAGLHRARDAQPARAARARKRDSSARITCTCSCRRSRSPTTTATAGWPIRASPRCRSSGSSRRRMRTSAEA